MTNIIITQKCNLKCSYCFANEFVNKENEEISFENFVIALDFILKSPREQIGFIGGEPTIHPQFDAFLKYLLKIKKEKKFNNRVMIYSNGIMIEQYIDLLKKCNAVVLINCNAPEIIGNSNYEKLQNNLIKLRKNIKNKLNLGINLFDKNMNTDFIFDLLKMTNSNYLRVSLTVPNSNITSQPLPIFNKNKDFIFKFLNKCFENNILTIYDCNALPKCLLSNEEIDVLKSYHKKYESNIFIKKPPFNLLTYPRCSPVIDIFPDLTAVRCFGFSNYMRIPISDFDSPFHIKKFFQAEIDRYADLLPASDECIDCKRKKSMECFGGCLFYKFPDIIELKKMYNEYIKKRLK